MLLSLLVAHLGCENKLAAVGQHLDQCISEKIDP